jgi:hypothetical protein
MRRLLLATTAVTALALGTPSALAQSGNGPSGALEEQKQPSGKSGKAATPTTPGQGVPTSFPIFRVIGSARSHARAAAVLAPTTAGCWRHGSGTWRYPTC